MASDPFYAALQAGASDKVKPNGKPYDTALQDVCVGGHLSKSSAIGAVSIVIVGVVMIGLSLYYFWQKRENKYERQGSKLGY
jgi:endoglucanase